MEKNMDKATKMFFVVSKDIPFNGYNDDFIAFAFHHGKVMTCEEYAKYHNEGKDANDRVESYELYDKCYEYCPHCEDEVVLDSRFELQICPSCGRRIAPCNLCGGNCPNPCPLRANDAFKEDENVPMKLSYLEGMVIEIMEDIEGGYLEISDWEHTIGGMLLTHIFYNEDTSELNFFCGNIVEDDYAEQVFPTDEEKRAIYNDIIDAY